MPSLTFEPDARTLERVARALGSVPRAAYSVPHVYPSAAPAYTQAPMAERPALEHDRLRLYVHIPFCRYHCTFCYFAVRITDDTDAMARYVRALKKELDWVEAGTPLSQLFVGGGTPRRCARSFSMRYSRPSSRGPSHTGATCTRSRPHRKRFRPPTSKC